jgi:hypothetical protein
MEGWYGVEREDSTASSTYSPVAGPVEYNNGPSDCTQGKEIE